MMREPAIRFVVPILILGAACSLLTIRLFHEPSINGKSISDWVDIYQRHVEDFNLSTNAIQCIEAIKTIQDHPDIVIPWAFKAIHYRRPPWQEHLIALSERLNGRKWLPKGFVTSLYAGKGDRAMFCFQALGSKGLPAIPRLADIATSTPSGSVLSDRVFYSLSHLGTNALPPLFEMVADEAGTHRRRAIYAIATIAHNNPLGGDIAVPFLVRFLRHADRDVASAATIVLGKLALRPDIAVPELVACVQSRDLYLRRLAIESLENFGPEAQIAVNELTLLQGAPEEDIRSAATNVLRDPLRPKTPRARSGQPPAETRPQGSLRSMCAAGSLHCGEKQPTSKCRHPHAWGLGA